MYLDAGFGKEPIPLFEADGQGHRLRAEVCIPIAPQRTCRTSPAQWLGVRRDRPDYLVLYRLGCA